MKSRGALISGVLLALSLCATVGITIAEVLTPEEYTLAAPCPQFNRVPPTPPECSTDGNVLLWASWRILDKGQTTSFYAVPPCGIDWQTPSHRFCDTSHPIAGSRRVAYAWDLYGDASLGDIQTSGFSLRTAAPEILQFYYVDAGVFPARVSVIESNGDTWLSEPLEMHVLEPRDAPRPEVSVSWPSRVYSDEEVVFDLSESSTGYAFDSIRWHMLDVVGDGEPCVIHEESSTIAYTFKRSGDYTVHFGVAIDDVDTPSCESADSPAVSWIQKTVRVINRPPTATWNEPVPVGDDAHLFPPLDCPDPEVVEGECPQKADFEVLDVTNVVAFSAVVADSDASDNHNYHWAFGDGCTSDESSPIHNYSHRTSSARQLYCCEGACYYTVTLTVTDTGTPPETVITKKVLAIVDTPPEADLQLSNPAPLVGSQVELLCRFHDPSMGGGIAEIGLDFGDGTSVKRGHTGTEEVFHHVYEEPGEYTVQLVVIDDTGALGSDSEVITVISD